MTKTELDRVLAYDPDTGLFTWKTSRGQNKVGAEAGSLDSWGYWRIQVYKENYRAHRLAWLTMTGEMPVGDVCHINRIKDDNRWVNLELGNRGMGKQA